MDEDQYKKDLVAAGVDLPELNDQPQADPKPQDKPKDEPKDTPKDDPQDPPQDVPKDDPQDKKVLSQDKPPADTPPRKRSIYDEYKDKKLEAKSATERAEIAERERDELKAKLAAIGNADTPADKKVAEDELVEFAKEIGADPTMISKLRDLILKDARPGTDKELTDRLARFEAWEKENSHAIEQSYYEKEFAKVTPSLKELFPTVNDAELGAIKTELDKISHTREWHDKDLSYVAFMNRDKLGALVSPKKRGLEPKVSRDDVQVSRDFDPNADYASMTPAEREIWEKEYATMMKTPEGLTTGTNGKKLII